jgi:hypothetical protein
MSPDNYLHLVLERGWTEAAYKRCLVETLTAAVLPPTCGGNLERPPASGGKRHRDQRDGRGRPG